MFEKQTRIPTAQISIPGLPLAWIDEIEMMAGKAGLSRAGMLRQLIAAGMQEARVALANTYEGSVEEASRAFHRQTQARIDRLATAEASAVKPVIVPADVIANDVADFLASIEALGAK